MRYGLILSLLFAVPCLAQTTKTGEARTTGPCSPAVSGSNNTFTFNCEIDKRQGEKMLDILNKILTNQLDPDAVIAKLDDIQQGVNEVKKHVNPYKVQVTYSLTGLKRETSPGLQAATDEAVPEYRVLQNLMDNHEWAKLVERCEVEMQKRPEWLTPYAFAGIAYTNLGDKEKALPLLEHASEGMMDNDATTKMSNAGGLIGGQQRAVDCAARVPIRTPRESAAGEAVGR
jgi:hypothetical protein